MGLTERLISPIFATAGSPSTFRSSKIRYDYAIGGIPFASGVSQEAVYEDVTAPWRRQQVDQSEEPGEQSLDGWWLRSQATFHAGAGQKTLDGADLTGEFRTQRFMRSKGVDVWTAGRASLLKDTAKHQSVAQATPAFAVGAPAGTPRYWVGDGTVLRYGEEVSGTGTVAWGGAGTILSLASDGTRIFVGDNVGVWNPATRIYDTGSSKVLLRWAKQRLMAGVGAGIYELDPNNTGPTTLPTAKFTHPNPDWTWTDIVEGPGAIYACGYAGNNGAIFKFILDDAGAVPTLTTGLKSAELPLGETAHSMLAYLGTFLVIGTSKGVRVARFDGTDVQYGPLSVSTSAAVYALTAEDRFVYAGWTDPDFNDACGLVRLDLSMEVAAGAFAWANDLRASNYVDSGTYGEVPQTGTVYGAGVLGSLLVFAVGGVGVYLEASTRLAASGKLTASRTRYRIAEPKLFRSIRYRCAGSAGTISVAAGKNTDTVGGLAYSVDVAADAVSDDVEISGDPCEFVTLEFGFARKAGAPAVEEGPRLEEYVLKALPAQRRQRLITVPLRAWDVDRDSTGQTFGYPGWALYRKEALEDIENAGEPVLFQVLAGPAAQQRSRLVVVEELRYVQAQAPLETAAWGGLLIATLRTVT